MRANFRKWALAPVALGLVVWGSACSETGPAGLVDTPQAPPLFGETDPSNSFGACMGDDVVAYNALPGSSDVSGWTNPVPNGNFCTSKDVYLAEATVYEVFDPELNEFVPVDGPITCNENELFQVKIAATLGQQAASARSDVGIWIAQADDPETDQAPTQAVTGTCNHYNLIPGQDGALDLDGEDGNPGDQCGDYDSSIAEASLDLDVLTLKCSPNENNKVEVPSCIGWTVPGADRVCPFGGTGDINFRAGTVPANTSKCNCENFELDIIVLKSAELEVRKVIDPTTDGGLFDLLIDAVIEGDDQGHNGTTGIKTVSAGTSADPGATHTFAEAAGTGTSLSDYTTTWECRDRGGLAGSRGSGTGVGANNIELEPDDDVVCTFTNVLKRATLTLEKTVVNDDGGTATEADFQASISGNDVDWDDPQTLLPGNYTASETVMTGYTAGDWGGDCAADGTITLAPGEDATCTITNDDQPATLKLVKTVVNDNGGTATEDDFQGKIDGADVDWDVATEVTPGNHTASEVGVAGYTAGDWGGDCAANGTVSIALGQHKTCTITNNDQPAKLTLVKTVINDNGGLATEGDFQAYIDTDAVDWDAETTLDAGNYTASEDELTGYTASDWGGDCDADGSITLANGDDKTCTITNDDQPATLTLVKTVVGGTAVASDFQAYINGGAVPWAVAQDVGAGSFTATESVVAGYTAGAWGGDCAADGTVTLALGENKTCSITNTFTAVETETAWASNLLGTCCTLKFNPNNKKNWATYVAYADQYKKVTLYAGQTEDVGYVEFSAVAGGMVTITVTLTGGWTFADGSVLKVQGYGTEPRGNPSPGQFAGTATPTTATTASITVADANFFAVHAVVQE